MHCFIVILEVNFLQLVLSTSMPFSGAILSAREGYQPRRETMVDVGIFHEFPHKWDHGIVVFDIKFDITVRDQKLKPTAVVFSSGG